MAARKNVKLTIKDARRVATGDASLTDLAAEMGVSKQGIWHHFKKHGWPTGPTDGGPPSQVSAAALPAPNSSPDAAAAPHSTKGRQMPASARPAMLASSSPSAPVASPEAPQAPETAEIRTAEEMVEHARRAVAVTALAALDRAHEVLTRPIGAQALKAAVAATVLAADQLRRAGFDIATAGEAHAPKMIIAEMTAAQVEETQRKVEALHRRASGIEDDELIEDHLGEGEPGSQPRDLASARRES